jgi:hypothetical protein
MFTSKYKSPHEERVEAGFLSKASPEEVVRWLRDNYKEPSKGIYGESLDVYKEDGRRLIEYILSRRNDALIDHGLARYGCSRYAIQKAYDRGDVSTRAAAVGNVRGGAVLRQADEILRTGKYALLCALLGNKWLRGGYIEVVLRRKRAFSDISDDRLAVIVSALTGNERLRTPYQSLYLDGGGDYQYHLPFHAAWDLTKTVPANQEWAGILWNLLGHTVRPYTLEKQQAAIERWNIDNPPEKPGRWFSRSPSFFVRSLLYDFKTPDKTLLGSDDAACRYSFYRRFSPDEFRDWPRFLKIDGEEFAHAALQNENLWRSATHRQALARVCWDSPDPDHSMDMRSYFRADEQRHRERHPEWFAEAPDSPWQEPLEQILNRLERLETALLTIPRKRSWF